MKVTGDWLDEIRFYFKHFSISDFVDWISTDKIWSILNKLLINIEQAAAWSSPNNCQSIIQRGKRWKELGPILRYLAGNSNKTTKKFPMIFTPNNLNSPP